MPASRLERRCTGFSRIRVFSSFWSPSGAGRLHTGRAFASTRLIVFWLWMAWDLGGNDNLSSSEKFYWMLAFLFMNVFAAVFYYVYEYRKRH